MYCYSLYETHNWYETTLMLVAQGESSTSEQATHRSRLVLVSGSYRIELQEKCHAHQRREQSCNFLHRAILQLNPSTSIVSNVL